MRLADRSQERGDTIIEVIFAIAIFSFVAVGSLSIMNQGIAIGERALEITLVRQQMDAQAEALRYIHEARVATLTVDEPAPGTPAETWVQFKTVYNQAGASPYGELQPDGSCKLPEESYKPFVLNARTAQVWTGTLEVAQSGGAVYPPYSQVIYSESEPSVVDAAYGMWVEAVPSSMVVAQPFIDFHIRACWDAPGSSLPMTLGTIVRLYDPNV